MYQLAGAILGTLTMLAIIAKGYGRWGWAPVAAGRA